MFSPTSHRHSKLLAARECCQSMFVTQNSYIQIFRMQLPYNARADSSYNQQLWVIGGWMVVPPPSPPFQPAERLTQPSTLMAERRKLVAPDFPFSLFVLWCATFLFWGLTVIQDNISVKLLFLLLSVRFISSLCNRAVVRIHFQDESMSRQVQEWQAMFNIHGGGRTRPPHSVL